MNQYDAFISELNEFIHKWLYAYKNVELKYVYIEGEDIDEETAYPDSDFMYILWANGKQSRIDISTSSTREILLNFLNKRYEDVPEDEYI
jgi:hypothetical protein